MREREGETERCSCKFTKCGSRKRERRERMES